MVAEPVQVQAFRQCCATPHFQSTVLPVSIISPVNSAPEASRNVLVRPRGVSADSVDAAAAAATALPGLLGGSAAAGAAATLGLGDEVWNTCRLDRRSSLVDPTAAKVRRRVPGQATEANEAWGQV